MAFIIHFPNKSLLFVSFMDFGGPWVHCRWKFGFGSLAFVLKWRPFLFIPMLIGTGSLFYTWVWLLNKFVFWKRLDFYSRFSFRLRHFSDAFPEFDLVTDWQFRPPFATNWPIICQGFSAVDFQWISTTGVDRFGFELWEIVQLPIAFALICRCDSAPIFQHCFSQWPSLAPFWMVCDSELLVVVTHFRSFSPGFPVEFGSFLVVF